MFIVVHQIDELWFKLILRELSGVRDLFARPHVPDRRSPPRSAASAACRSLLQHVAHHFEVMETLTTRDYLEFRDKLIPASGFQSAQLREIEILLGLADAERIPLGREHATSEALRRGRRLALARRRSASRRASPTRPTPRARPSASGSRARPSRARSRASPTTPARSRASSRPTWRPTPAPPRAPRRWRPGALTPEDTERLRARYEKEIRRRRAFLLAPRTRRGRRGARASRVRAAHRLHRELPRAAAPRLAARGGRRASSSSSRRWSSCGSATRAWSSG